jgi:hypothetical protein
MYDIFYVSASVGNEEQWLALKSKYPLSQRVNNVKTYKDIETKSFTKMFWVIWDDITLLNDFDLTAYRATKWDEQYVHVFKNGEHYDGVCLFPKNIVVSNRELHHRFFTAKKEIDILASTPEKYKVYTPRTYEEYLAIKDQMFWVVWSEVTIINESVFDLYFSHHNSYDRRENHVFKHLFNDTEIFSNGVVLFSKEKLISQQEFNHRYLINKKEHKLVASTHKEYDVVFISYQEVNADDNYSKLLTQCPRAKRVHGVKGIHQAHIAAATLCNTDMIWVVDGDAKIDDNFNFDLVMSSYDTDCVHVWRSRNPVNNLEYGNGGVKLLPRRLTLDMDTSSADMTTSISKKFKAVQTVSNTNAFNTDQFTAWRSAFRECCKLAAGTIVGQKQDETDRRLTTWCTVGQGMPFGTYSIMGAIAGKAYGTANQHNTDNLRKINDFEWLAQQFSNDHTYVKNKITD